MSVYWSLSPSSVSPFSSGFPRTHSPALGCPEWNLPNCRFRGILNAEAHLDVVESVVNVRIAVVAAWILTFLMM